LRGLALGLGSGFGSALFGALLRRRGGLIDLLLRLLVALHQLGRYALVTPGTPSGKDRLAIPRQLGLGIPELG